MTGCMIGYALIKILDIVCSVIHTALSQSQKQDTENCSAATCKAESERKPIRLRESVLLHRDRGAVSSLYHTYE